MEAKEMGPSSSFALARALEASGLWTQALSTSEHLALLRRLESQRSWDAFMGSSVQAGGVSLQLKVRALLVDRSVAGRMGHDSAVVAAVSGFGGSAASAEGSLRRGVDLLQASDLFFTLEDDREDWDSLSSSARASDPWVQGLRNKYKKALSTDPKDSKPGSSGADGAASQEEKQRLQRVLCRELERVLDELNNLGEAVGPFFTRVKAADAPDYYQVITKPMDLSTVREKVRKGKYSSVEACRKDIDLIVNNCCKYNKPGSTFVAFAQQLQKSAHSLLMTAEGRVAAAKERAKDRQEPVESLPAFRDRLRSSRSDSKHPDGGPTPQERRRDDPGADSIQWYKKERLKSFKPRMELLAERRSAALEPLAERPALIRSPEAMAHHLRTPAAAPAAGTARDHQRSAGLLGFGPQRWGKKDSLAPQEPPPVLDHLSLRDLANGVPEPLALRDGTPGSVGSSGPAVEGSWGGAAQGPGHPALAPGVPPQRNPVGQGGGVKSAGAGTGGGTGFAGAGAGSGGHGVVGSAAVARQKLRAVCLRQIAVAGFGGGAKSSAVEVLLDTLETHVEGIARQVGSVLEAATSAPRLAALPLLSDPHSTAAASWKLRGACGGSLSLPLQAGLLPRNGVPQQEGTQGAAPGLGDAVAFLIGLTKREELGNHGRLPPLAELRAFASTGKVQGRFQSPLGRVAHHGHAGGGASAKRKAGGRGGGGGDGAGPSGPAKRSRKESKAAADKDVDDREAGGALPLTAGAPPLSSPRTVGQGRGGASSSAGAGKGTEGVPLAGLGSPSKSRKSDGRKGGAGATLGLGSRGKAAKGGRGVASKAEMEAQTSGADSLTPTAGAAGAGKATGGGAVAGGGGATAGSGVSMGGPLAPSGGMSGMPGLLNRNESRPGAGAGPPGSAAAFSTGVGAAASLRPAQGLGAPPGDPRAAAGTGPGRVSPVADTAGGAASPSGVHHQIGGLKGHAVGGDFSQGRAAHGAAQGVLLPLGSDDSLAQGQGQGPGPGGERPAVYRVTTTGNLGSGSPLHVPQSPSSAPGFPQSPRHTANPAHGLQPSAAQSPTVEPSAAAAAVPASPGAAFPSGAASPKRWSGSLQAQLQGQQKVSPKLQPLQLPASAEPQRLVLRAQPETSPAKPKVYPGLAGGGAGVGAVGGAMGGSMGQGLQGGLQVGIQGMSSMQGVQAMGAQGMQGMIGGQGQPGSQDGQHPAGAGGGGQFSALHMMQHSRSLPEIVLQHSQDGQGQVQYGQQAPGAPYRQPGFSTAGTPLGGLAQQQQQQAGVQQQPVLNAPQSGVQLQRQVSYPELRRQASQDETAHGQMAYRPHQGFVQQHSLTPLPHQQSMQQTMLPPQPHAVPPQTQASTPKS